MKQTVQKALARLNAINIESNNQTEHRQITKEQKPNSGREPQKRQLGVIARPPLLFQNSSGLFQRILFHCCNLLSWRISARAIPIFNGKLKDTKDAVNTAV